MDKYIVMGGTRLSGCISTSGAKNSILPIMAASLLSKKQCIIHDVPKLLDVFVMSKVLETLGAKVKVEGSALVIDPSGVEPRDISEPLMRKLRASNLVIGSLLSRYGKVKVAYPGGCNIGSRPMDLHLKGFRFLGAKISEKHGFIEAEAAELKGTDIHLDFPSVGATENLMMAASLAKGTTIIRNAAREPEIVDLQNFLNAMGAKIRGAGLDVIKIEGVEKLGPAEHTIIPDRIEAGTYMAAAAVTGGDVLIKNVIPDHLEPITAKLREAGAEIIEYEDSVRVKGRHCLNAVDCKTLPYPGFPTDMQPQITAILSMAEGTSIISESIFENRFKHIDELKRMGANIKLEGRTAVIKGVTRLTGAFVEATDLRAGAAMVLAGLAAEDATVIENIYHIDRGYECMEKKYAGLGARIIRVNSSNHSS